MVRIRLLMVEILHDPHHLIYQHHRSSGSIVHIYVYKVSLSSTIVHWDFSEPLIYGTPPMRVFGMAAVLSLSEQKARDGPGLPGKNQGSPAL